MVIPECSGLAPVDNDTPGDTCDITYENIAICPLPVSFFVKLGKSAVFGVASLGDCTSWAQFKNVIHRNVPRVISGSKNATNSGEQINCMPQNARLTPVQI